MKIRKYKNSDLKEVANLIKITFKKFSKTDGSKKAVEAYIKKYNNMKKLKLKFEKSKIFYVAEDKGKIIGVIRGNPDRVTNLFVDSKYHGKGIGKKLLKRFEQEAKKQKSKAIKIRASLYAIPFYKNNGYKKTTGIKTGKVFPGLKFQPMIKRGDNYAN